MSDENRDPWLVRDSVTEYANDWYAGGYDLVEQPDGSTKRYYWASLPPAVVVVPIVDDSVVFVEQYRPAIREHQLELPAGLFEAHESPTDAAERELREETGFRAMGLAHLQDNWVATGILRHKRSVVFAEGLVPTETDRDQNEFLSVTTRPRDGAIAAAREQPSNAMTLAALLLAKEEGLL